MSRRRFDHLVAEISVELGLRVPRYELWMRLHEHGWDPENLSQEAALAFCESPLRLFLADRGLWLSSRAERRLQRNVRRFDPARTAPEEHFARL